MPLVEAACRVGARRPLADLGLRDPEPRVVSVKEAVLPFARFPGSDPLLGPEMRATGEVMAIAPDFATAFAKALRAVGPAAARAAARRPVGRRDHGLRPRQARRHAARAAAPRPRLPHLRHAAARRGRIASSARR